MNASDTPFYYRLAATMERARELAAQTQRLAQRTRSAIHAARNSRHHAGLIRALARITRSKPRP